MSSEVSLKNEELVVTTFYTFVSFSEEVLAAAARRATLAASSLDIAGLVVMGCEGMNATIAGKRSSIEAFKQLVVELAAMPVEFKDSPCAKIPFARFKVDIRPEIVTSKCDLGGVLPKPETYLTAEEWDRMLSEDPDIVVIDTRNSYEVEIGKFRGAVDPKISKFSEFPEFVAQAAIPKDKKVLLYCTGGIRCEKAVVEMQQLGYASVFHLKGGILKYFQESRAELYEGECFVFDHRVAVDKKLEPSKTYRLCPHCGNPARKVISCVQCNKETIVCEPCLEREDRRSCSKNCAYHLRRRSAPEGALLASPEEDRTESRTAEKPAFRLAGRSLNVDVVRRTSTALMKRPT